jgi:hypothetical protein
MTTSTINTGTCATGTASRTNRGGALVRSMNRLGSWRVWIVSGAIFLVFAGAFFASSAPFAVPSVENACGQAPLDVRFFSTGGDVSGFLDACGPAGRDAYQSMQVADLFYPLVFGVFMASSIAFALRRLASRRPSVVMLAGVPLIGAGVDYLENIFAWRALAAFPDSARTDSLLGFASAAKTVTFWIAGVILLVAVGALVARLVRRRVARRGGDQGVAVGSQIHLAPTSAKSQ